MGLKLVKNAYEIVQCLECDFLCVDPMPSTQQITDYYATAYRGAAEDWYPKDLDRRWRAFTRSLLFVRYILSKDVVDLGCGGGQMLQALGRFAKSATGVDLSSNSIAFARKHFAKHTFYDEPLSTFAQRGLTYDFVFSSERCPRARCFSGGTLPPGSGGIASEPPKGGTPNPTPCRCDVFSDTLLALGFLILGPGLQALNCHKCIA